MKGKWHRCLEPFACGIKACARGVRGSRWGSWQSCGWLRHQADSTPQLTRDGTTHGGGFQRQCTGLLPFKDLFVVC